LVAPSTPLPTLYTIKSNLCNARHEGRVGGGRGGRIRGKLVPSLIERLRVVQGLRVVPVFWYRYSMKN